MAKKTCSATAGTEEEIGLEEAMEAGLSMIAFFPYDVDVTPQDALLAEPPIGGQMEPLKGGRGSS